MDNSLDEITISAKDLEKKLKSDVKLSSELSKYIKDINGFKFIHCKYIVSLYSGTGFENELFNKAYEESKKELKELLDNKEYKAYIEMVARPYRLEEFIKILNYIPEEQLFEIFEFVWADSENPMVNYEVWKYLFNLDILKPYFEKTKEDLPEKFTIYRGTKNIVDNGISWTLSKEKANWFAERFYTKINRTGFVLFKEVLKSEVVMYTNSRNEQEIIYFNPKGYNIADNDCIFDECSDVIIYKEQTFKIEYDYIYNYSYNNSSIFSFISAKNNIINILRKNKIKYDENSIIFNDSPFDFTVRITGNFGIDEYKKLKTLGFTKI